MFCCLKLKGGEATGAAARDKDFMLIVDLFDTQCNFNFIVFCAHSIMGMCQRFFNVNELTSVLDLEAAAMFFLFRGSVTDVFLQILSN